MHYAKLRKIITTSLFIVIAIALGLYAYYQSHSFLTGPQITIFTPEDGKTFYNPFISIEGKAEYISHLTLNDRQIFVDENNLFSEKLLLLPGYNIITIKAEDKFNRNTKKTLKLVLIEENLIEINNEENHDNEENQN